MDNTTSDEHLRQLLQILLPTSVKYLEIGYISNKLVHLGVLG